MQKNFLTIIKNYAKIFLKFLKSNIGLNKIFFKKTKIYKPKYPVNFKNELCQGFENYKNNQSALNDFLLILPEIFANNYYFKPLSDLFDLTNDEQNISIRVDIDAYPPAAVNLARHLSYFHIPASFFFLHSAKYYIKQENSYFYRNPDIEKWLIEIASLGMEIGLHNDILSFSKSNNIDPFRILFEEISFIRNLGIRIKGTVSHNNFALHCAENFEVFKELQTYLAPNKSISYSNYINKIRKKYPINTISMTGLGLTYEGNYPCQRNNPVSSKYFNQILDPDKNGITNSTWMNCYINNNPSFSRKYDCDIWLLPNRKWMISDRSNNIFLHNISLTKFREYIISQKKSKTTVLTIHPEYLMENHINSLLN